MDNQKFIIEIDGIEKEATILNVLNIEDKEYAIYSVDNGNETSDVFYSQIQKDEFGYDKLVDVTDQGVKNKILEYINTALSE